MLEMSTTPNRSRSVERNATTDRSRSLGRNEATNRSRSVGRDAKEAWETLQSLFDRMAVSSTSGDREELLLRAKKAQRELAATVPMDCQEKFRQLFDLSRLGSPRGGNATCLPHVVRETERDLVPESGMIGTILDEDGNVGERIYMNTSDPFCMIVVGVQGAGK